MAKSRAEILAMAQRSHVEVQGIRLQSLTELERSNLEAMQTERIAKIADENPGEDARYIPGLSAVLDRADRELLAVCIVDAEGQRIFADAEVDDVGSLPSGLFAELLEAAQNLNPKKGKAEKLEKKSDATPG